MKVNTERIEKNKVLLEIEVEPAQLDKAIVQAYKKVVKQVNIPGFRKGKAPRPVLERFVGKDAIYGEAAEIVVPDTYVQAVKESGIEPIDQPKIDIVTMEEGQPFVFKATVEVKPEVTLGDYKGLTVERPTAEVTEADVQEELKRLQNRHARLITVEEGEVQNDDTVMLNFAGYLDGEQFEGGTAENYSLVIGSGSFIPGFEEQLIGVKVGEEKDVDVTFPENYHAANLAGKPVVFKCKINSIKRKELSPLDDEFAKDVSEFDTLEELKQDILNKLRETAVAKADSSVKDQLVDKAVANATVDVPPVMVDTRAEELLSNLGNRLRQQGMDMDQYFKITNSSAEEMRNRMKPEAEGNVKTELVLDAIAKAEGITATDEQVDQEIAKVAESFKQDPKVFRAALESRGDVDFIKNDIVRREVIELLLKEANIKDVTNEQAEA